MSGEHLISLEPGTVIAGRYEVVKCLGAGSMGMVYACRHRELSGHLMAVKVLFPEVAQDRVAAQRFRNEIFASYGVSHPNVVRAYEFIRDGDLVAYTMEYVGGGDLAERLGDPERPIPVPEIVNILAQMCLGVQAIHDAGIIHRDLKPENILLTKEGSVKIADFGIAKAGNGPRLTEHGGVVGTIDYVSPEYMLNSHVDWRSDIYAMGILAYEMLAGTSPFRGDSVYATMTKRLKMDPAPPSSIRKDCPAELDRIVLRAMQRDPAKRYQAAVEMFQDLQSLLPDQGGRIGAAYAAVPPRSRLGTPGKSVLINEPAQDITDTAQRKPVGERRSSGSMPDSRRGSGVPELQTYGDMPNHATVDLRPMRDNLGRTGPSVQLPTGRSPSGTRRRSEFEDAGPMERVLGGGPAIESGNKPAALSPEAGTFVRKAIAPERMRELSRMTRQKKRGGLGDFILIILALVFGIGLGLGTLQLVAPRFLGREGGLRIGTMTIAPLREVLKDSLVSGGSSAPSR